MNDLFEREEKILQYSLSYLEANSHNQSCSHNEYRKLVKEYARILKQLRRFTKVSDQTTIELNQDKINLLSKVHIDSLTGLYNRRFFDEEINSYGRFCMENQVCLGVLMLDVDFFKQYNDTYGHSAGDQCLRMIANTVRKEIREDEGFVARYGGEEFVIVLQDTNPVNMSKIAERIIDKIRKLGIPHENNNNKGIVTVSIGGYCNMDLTALSCNDYVKYADKALYQSKQSGRDKYSLYYKED